MHLAYLDDAGTDTHSPITMFGAVIVSPDNFGHLEAIHNTAIQQIIPADQVEEKFREFHASELYQGTGAFDGIVEEKRFTAIRVLLMALQSDDFPYIYAAIDRKKLRKSPMGSASPSDTAFRLCALGVEDWARGQHSHPPGSVRVDHNDLCLYILDETKDKPLKEQLRKSYRDLRAAHPYVPPHENRLWHAHDDMYFSDSRDSAGIQMADLCNYFMWRHLLKKEGGEEFYAMFASHAQCAKPEPEWTTYRDLFWTHDQDEQSSTKELTTK